MKLLASFLVGLYLFCSAAMSQNTASVTSTRVNPAAQESTNIAVIQEGIQNEFNGLNWQGIIDQLRQVQPAVGLNSTENAIRQLQQVHAANSSTLYDYLANLRAFNLIDSVDSLIGGIQGLEDGQNSMRNSNPDPRSSIYPTRSSCDAPYSVSESDLRSAIYIPSGFTRGQKPPLILFPGTGATGFFTFIGNYIPLLQSSGWADPVWVNVPGYLLDDAQVSAEYAAYAVNYVASLTGHNVTVVTWSQGAIDVQWAFKYWPSTRQVVSDHVAISPDYAGTIQASFIAPPGAPLPPSVLNQKYLQSSQFITTLRDGNGDSAYVPVTTIYSAGFDEIVEPQAGTDASAFLLDVRGVGVTNNEVQTICAGQPAGTLYTHEGVLYNPLGFALLYDAMTHDGPGQIARLDLSSVCSQYLTPGLDVGDLLLTENAILVAGLSILLYEPKVLDEPTLMPYAANGRLPGTCGNSTSGMNSTTTVPSSGSTSTNYTMTSTTYRMTSATAYPNSSNTFVSNTTTMLGSSPTLSSSAPLSLTNTPSYQNATTTLMSLTSSITSPSWLTSTGSSGQYGSSNSYAPSTLDPGTGSKHATATFSKSATTDRSGSSQLVNASGSSSNHFVTDFTLVAASTGASTASRVSGILQAATTADFASTTENTPLVSGFAGGAPGLPRFEPLAILAFAVGAL